MIPEGNAVRLEDPQVQQAPRRSGCPKALKVTIVALTALAALAGIIALGVLVAPVYTALIIPAAIVMAIVLIATRKKISVPQHPVQTGNGLVDALVDLHQTKKQGERDLAQAQAHLAATIARVDAGQRQEVRKLEQARPALLEMLLEAQQQLNRVLVEDPELSEESLSLVQNSLREWNTSFLQQQIFGVPFSQAEAENNTKLFTALVEIYNSTNANMQDVTSKTKQRFTNLQQDIRTFLEKYATIRLPDLKATTNVVEPEWHQGYRDLMIVCRGKIKKLLPGLYATFNGEEHGPMLMDVILDLKKIADFIEAQRQKKIEMDFDKVTQHQDFVISLNAFAIKIKVLADQFPNARYFKMGHENAEAVLKAFVIEP